MMVFINFGIRFIHLCQTSLQNQQLICCLEFRIDPWSVCLFGCLVFSISFKQFSLVTTPDEGLQILTFTET